MTDQPPAPPADSWESILDNLRRRYPGQKDSVLFCINKLQQNPDLSLRDFRDEASLYGIPMAGRSLHSAKTLLGLLPQGGRSDGGEAEAAAVERPRRRRSTPQADDDSIESKVISAVRSLQSAASEETERLRRGIREAIAVLQRALGG